MTDTHGTAETLARKIAEMGWQTPGIGRDEWEPAFAARILPLIREHDRERVSAKVEAFTLVKQLRDDLRERDQEIARLREIATNWRRRYIEVERSDLAARRKLDEAKGLLNRGGWALAKCLIFKSVEQNCINTGRIEDNNGCLPCDTRAFLAAPAPQAKECPHCLREAGHEGAHSTSDPAPVAQPEGTHEFVPHDFNLYGSFCAMSSRCHRKTNGRWNCEKPAYDPIHACGHRGCTLRFGHPGEHDGRPVLRRPLPAL